MDQSSHRKQHHKQACRAGGVGRLLTALLIGVVVTLSSPAALAQTSGGSSRQTVGDLLRSIQSEINAMSRTIRTTNASNQQQMRGLSRSLANVSGSLVALEEEMRRMQGNFEGLENTLTKVRADIAALQALSASSGQRSSSLAPQSPALSRDSAAQGGGDAALEASPEDTIRRAEALVAAEQYDAALEALQPIISAGGDAAVEARYVHGEALYHTDDYRGAAGSLILALGQRNNSARKDNGLLYLARSLVGLGQPEQACATFREVMSTATVSSVLNAARREMADLC